MASTSFARTAGAQTQAFAAPVAVRPVRNARLICRAEEKAVTKGINRNVKTDTLHFSSEATLAYLDGTLPGDFGFDPLGLLDPKNSGGFIEPNWLKYSEVFHGRWAMLGAAGLIAPEILGKAGLIPPETGNVRWFESGVIPPAGTYSDYWTDPWSLFWLEVIAMQFAELRRWQDFRKPGSMGKQYFLGLEGLMKGSGDPAYPGGPFFNVFNLGSDPKEMAKLKVNEIKNGRLAMIAVFGYGSQALLTRQGPYQNLLDHLSDPIHNNIIGNFYKVYGQ